MATKIPSSMRALSITDYSKPSGFDIATLPTPEIYRPDQILIKVLAASVNSIDVKMASGMTKLFHKDKFPYKLGLDAAGIVIKVGNSVTTLQPGDHVFTRVPLEYRGTIAEYALSTSSATSKMPYNVSFVQAASIPHVALTALQSMRVADTIIAGGLKGKTVFIPAGLSGTGSIAIQLAKHVFGAAKVITSVSSAKVATAGRLLGNAVIDQIVDYTKEDLVEAIGTREVDYMFDTMNLMFKGLPIMKRGGVIVSISASPSGKDLAETIPSLPYIARLLLDLADLFRRFWAWRVGIHYTFKLMSADGQSLTEIKSWIEQGRLQPVVGRIAKFSDIGGIRTGCEEIFEGKGGIGKFVIEMD